MSTAQGFWSYVHKDNEGMHGAITRVAEHVQDEYGVITGGLELDLFLDNMKLRWGDKWRDRIHDAIQNSTFFIPIVTPRYFKSQECRNELLGFAEQARALGREALIMPLYFVEVPELESGESSDPLIKLIADSQMKDWRNLRFLDQTTQPYRIALNDLATQLLEVSRERDSAAPQKSAPPEEDDEVHQEPAPATDSSTEQEALGEGMLEELVAGEDALPRLVETLNSMAPEIQKVGQLSTEASNEIEVSDAQGGGFKGRLAIAARLAKKLNVQADHLERLTSEYVADLVTIDPAMRRLIRLAAEQGPQDPQETQQFFSSIIEMIDGSEAAAEDIKDMIKAIDQAANISRELQGPLKRLRSSLQSMIDSNRRMEVWRADIEAAESSLGLSA